ncbi:MAG: BatD family protein [Jejuia sp.]
MKLNKHILFLLCFLAAAVLSGQVKFETKVSKKKLGVNERLRVDFEMDQDGDNFNPPSFNGFTVIGGPNQAVNYSWVNGKKTFKKSYSYFLAPKTRGALTIGQATIEIDGEIYKTTPVKVEITAAVDKPTDVNDPNYKALNTVHLVAEVSNSNPYLNEAITVVYKLYVAASTAVTNWREIDTPRYDDFWSQNLDTKGQRPQNTTYKDEDYRFLVLRKTVLYPQRTGELKLEPLSLNVDIQVPTNRRDIFGSRLMSKVSRTISAGSRTINVKALPTAGKPADFSGAVGDFSFKVTPSKTELDATESFQAKVEVRGKGNLKLFNLPKLNLPSSLEVYEPEHNENVTTTSKGMQGSISDTYTVVPQYRGKYPLPQILFSYFDLATESYKRLSSDEIVINVLDGPVNSANEGNTNTVNSSVKQPVLSSNQFAFIKTKTNFVSTKEEYFFKSKLFWSLLLGPFIAIPLAIVVRRKKATRDADVVGNKRRKADRLARKYLKGAKKELGKKEAFYEALEKALHNYLKAKLHIETSELSKDRIQKLLSEREVESDAINDFMAIFENCELARYTPITNVTMQEDYNKAAKTISLIDKQAR